MHFEFNQELLLFIANEINNSKYGTFMGNSPKDRLLLKLVEETESMWTFVLTEKMRFINIQFYPNMPSNELVITQIPNINF